jgi:predicted ATP-grasp superfamily ATP-dependent carboligase
MGEPVRLVGASVRAMAFSALRAGLRPECLDLFADADLAAVAPATRFTPTHYPQAALGWLAEGPPNVPWAYAGGLENHPALIRQLAATRPLWGCGAAALSRIRAPLHTAAILTAAGLPCPAVRGTPPPDDGRPWLVKPHASAGGTAVRFRIPGERPPPAVVYYQEFVPGDSCAGVFLASPDRCQLLGVTRQLVGTPWLHARPFQYCGSIGPLPLPTDALRHFARIGAVLARDSRLRGLFGVDAVLHAGQPWPVEVNPRYTASVEVLEYASGLPAFALHRQACLGAEEPPVAVRTGKVAGKAVVFAPRALTFPARGPWSEWLARLRQDARAVWERPDFADLPAAGAEIPAGGPVLTVLTEGSTIEECEAGLRRAAAEVVRLLTGA